MITKKKEKIIISPKDSININNIDFYKTKLTSVINKKNKTCILDLKNLKYLDCAGLNLILFLYRGLKSNNSQLIITNIKSDYIKKFIALVNLEEIINIS